MLIVILAFVLLVVFALGLMCIVTCISDVVDQLRCCPVCDTVLDEYSIEGFCRDCWLNLANEEGEK